MKVLGNSLFSKNFIYSDILLTDKGLFYKNEWNTSFTDEIFLTDNPKLIIELLKLNWEEIDKIEEEKIYPILVSSSYVRTTKFLIDTSNGKSSYLRKFSEYLKTIPQDFLDKKFNGISLEELCNFFPNLLDKLILSNELKNSNTKQKFNEAVKKIKDIPTFNIRELNNIIPKFNDKYSDTIERSLFLHKNSVDEISNEILNFI